MLSSSEIQTPPNSGGRRIVWGKTPARAPARAYSPVTPAMSTVVQKSKT